MMAVIVDYTFKMCF